MNDRGVKSLQELISTGSYKGKPSEAFHKTLSKTFRPKVLDEWQLKRSGHNMVELYVDPRDQHRVMTRTAIYPTVSTVQYYLEIDGRMLRHRFGAPAVYHYNDSGDFSLTEHGFYYLGVAYNPSVYYSNLSRQHPDLYPTYMSYKKIGKRKVFKESKLPCPCQIDVGRAQCYWRIGSEYVSMEKYFKAWEQVYVTFYNEMQFKINSRRELIAEPR